MPLRTRLNRAFDALPPAVNLLLGLALVAALGWLDNLTGDLSFIVFYIGPVAFVSWFASRWRGILVAAASTVAWVVADAMTADPVPSHAALSTWNVAMKLVFLLLVAAAVSALRRAYDEEEAMARTDPLTGLPNRRHLLDALRGEILRSRRYRRTFTLAFVDLDNFKAVNDRLGHDTGDRLLRGVADLIRSRLRETDLAGRIGGDEFAVLLPETGDDEAGIVLNAIRNALNALAAENGWPVTASVGALTCESPAASADELMQKADALMYAAKQAGKNRVEQGRLGT
jgi:diguanylate cyclase (GGDEF)-like protein